MRTEVIWLLRVCSLHHGPPTRGPPASLMRPAAIVVNYIRILKITQ